MIYFVLLFNKCRNDGGISVLICSRGGGGLLEERMELVAELWEENIKVGDELLRNLAEILE